MYERSRNGGRNVRSADYYLEPISRPTTMTGTVILTMFCVFCGHNEAEGGGIIPYGRMPGTYDQSTTVDGV